jgi:Na+-transporting methylmalonyl-CoA/oxaloacetate decarboxylase gamma subunit
MDTIKAGFMLMGYGLAGVFTALIIFYCAIRVLTALFKEKSKKEE